MLVGANCRAVQHHFFQIAILADGLKHAIPYPCLGPTREAREGGMPVTQLGGQIAPRRACSADPHTASRNNRLSFAVTPLSVALPGS